MDDSHAMKNHQLYSKSIRASDAVKEMVFRRVSISSNRPPPRSIKKSVNSVKDSADDVVSKKDNNNDSAIEKEKRKQKRKEERATAVAQVTNAMQRRVDERMLEAQILNRDDEEFHYTSPKSSKVQGAAREVQLAYKDKEKRERMKMFRQQQHEQYGDGDESTIAVRQQIMVEIGRRNTKFKLQGVLEQLSDIRHAAESNQHLGKHQTKRKEKLNN